jgi:hypothetical protein
MTISAADLSISFSVHGADATEHALARISLAYDMVALRAAESARATAAARLMVPRHETTLVQRDPVAATDRGAEAATRDLNEVPFSRPATERIQQPTIVPRPDEGGFSGSANPGPRVDELAKLSDAFARAALEAVQAATVIGQSVAQIEGEVGRSAIGAARHFDAACTSADRFSDGLIQAKETLVDLAVTVGPASAQVERAMLASANAVSVPLEQISVDVLAKAGAGQAALNLLSDSFTKAHEPVDLFAGQIDAAMSHVQTSITSHAIQSGASLATALVQSMAQAAAIAQQGAAAVDQAMAWLPGAMFNTGANASHAFAQGLWSGVGEAEAAARAMAAAADEAARSRLQINSPSKVFSDHADMVVEGFVGTLRSRSGEVAGAFSAFSPNLSSGSSSAYRPVAIGGNKVTIISVHASEIQKIAEMARSGHEFADGFANEFDMLTGGNFQ